MEVEFKVTQEEKTKVLQAVNTLNIVAHLKHMSYSAIGESCGYSITKTKAILDAMVQEGTLDRIPVGAGTVTQRYYYVIKK